MCKKMNRKRPRLSQKAVQTLEYLFQKTPYPTDEEIQFASEDSGESVKRVKTWFINRRTKAVAELSGRGKPSKRRSTIHQASQRPKRSKTCMEWKRTHEEQLVSINIPSASSPGNATISNVSNKKQTSVHFPCRRNRVTSGVVDDRLLARYAEMIEDKEYHEMMYDSS
ncbi:uncharacterized protein LOC133190970 [Saccostrea echinata]|uniref:uncharacterized protein LOC133190970 n=1 Tax=Saccostrea echinata TaxID=191078 RepID=UPI002A809CC1|nr:uncharacterized protein LOC133190970 [Saccostrea echinata]